MKRKSYFALLAIVLALLPFLYLAIAWDSIPAQVPLHYNLEMEVDRVGSKNELVGLVFILCAISLILFFIFSSERMYRKQPVNKSMMNGIAWCLLLLMTGLNFIFLISTSRQPEFLIEMLFPVIALSFSFLGNYMYNIKTNSIAGFRVSWTMNNEMIWRKTHHLAGRLWFWGGIIYAVFSYFIPFEFKLVSFILFVFILLMIPGIYSYLLYRNSKVNGAT